MLMLAIFLPVVSSQQCAEHPIMETTIVEKGSFKGEILERYSFHPIGRDWKPTTYQPRLPVTYRKIGSGHITIRNLDFFGTAEKKRVTKIKFQRTAVVFLLLEVHRFPSSATEQEAKLPGWKSAGWFERIRGPEVVKFGVGQHRAETMTPKKAFVFAIRGTSVTIPSSKTLKRRFPNLRATGRFSILVGERNGRPVEKPQQPRAQPDIVPGQLCPSFLHDLWVTKDADERDEQIREKLFRTYHPLIDPCYLCSYGHEHGSAAQVLMGYKPRYEYTALKNERQRESHTGFKDYVLDTPKHWVYFGIHSQMSSRTHFAVRHHTLAMAVVQKSSRKIVMETRFKADFGAAVVRRRADLRMIGVSPEQERLYRGRKEKFRRVVNVLDPKREDRTLHYRTPRSRVREGLYEQWSTTPFCSTSSRRSGGLVLDVQNPYLAMRKVVSSNAQIGEEAVELGKQRPNGQFEPNTSQRRQLDLVNLNISTSACFQEDDRPLHGFFYTDPYAKQRFEDPGENRVRHFAIDGFSLVLDGQFRLADEWLGLYTSTAKGEFQNIALGINEDAN